MAGPHLTRAELLSALDGVDGWLADDEAWALHRLARDVPGPDPVAVEIGTWMGRSTIAIALAFAQRGAGTVIAVDHHGPRRTGVDTWTHLHRNLEQAGVVEHVRPIRGMSVEVRGDINGPIDLLWIDGGHRYAQVIDDIDAWSDLLRPGARVAFHDVAVHGGPTRAVWERVLAEGPFRRPRAVRSVLIADYAPGPWTRADARSATVAAARDPGPLAGREGALPRQSGATVSEVAVNFGHTATATRSPGWPSALRSTRRAGQRTTIAPGLRSSRSWPICRLTSCGPLVSRPVLRLERPRVDPADAAQDPAVELHDGPLVDALRADRDLAAALGQHVRRHREAAGRAVRVDVLRVRRQRERPGHAAVAAAALDLELARVARAGGGRRRPLQQRRAALDAHAGRPARRAGRWCPGSCRAGTPTSCRTAAIPCGLPASTTPSVGGHRDRLAEVAEPAVRPDRLRGDLPVARTAQREARRGVGHRDVGLDRLTLLLVRRRRRDDVGRRGRDRRDPDVGAVRRRDDRQAGRRGQRGRVDDVDPDRPVPGADQLSRRRGRRRRPSACRARGPRSAPRGSRSPRWPEASRLAGAQRPVLVLEDVDDGPARDVALRLPADVHGRAGGHGPLRAGARRPATGRGRGTCPGARPRSCSAGPRSAPAACHAAPCGRRTRPPCRGARSATAFRRLRPERKPHAARRAGRAGERDVQLAASRSGSGSSAARPRWRPARRRPRPPTPRTA